MTFFEVLKGKSWNELHEKNKLIYYKKWGRPLKIAIILDGSSCNNEDKLAGIIDTVFYLARKQHHIDIWSPCKVGNRFRHTNINFKSYNILLMRPLVSLNLYMNKTKKLEKQYNATFSYDVRSNIAGEDFNNSIKKQVDAMKEKTKETVRVGL